MFQRWEHLAFLHWPVQPSVLRSHVPASLPLDLYEGAAWLTVSPHVVSRLRPRGLPPLPGASSFPELNVRTYVTRDGRPGVYFFSLNAGNRAAVEGARLAYALPYFFARFDIASHGPAIDYRCHRADPRGLSGQFAVRYQPVGPMTATEPGSLAHWLTERYCLYAVRRGRTFRTDIHHRRWPLQAADAEVTDTSLLDADWLTIPQSPVLAHFAGQLDVLVWAPRRVR